MEHPEKNQTEHKHEPHHIVSYKEHFSTLVALLLLTIVTVVISVFGASLATLSVATALLIATVKVALVAYNFMHLKYDLKLYSWLLITVFLLFAAIIILTSLEYFNR